MKQIKSFVFGLILLSNFLSVAKADDRNLVEIANEYDSSLQWGRELGQAPILFYLDSLSDFDNKVTTLERNLKRLKELAENGDNSQLILDLKNFTEQEIFLIRTCKPGVWDYAEYNQLLGFFNSTRHFLDSSDQPVHDKVVLEQTLQVFAEMLSTYIEMMRASIQLNLLPSYDSYPLHFKSAEEMSVGENDFLIFFDEFKNNYCLNCKGLAAEPYLQSFRKEIQPLLEKYFQTLEEVRFLSTYQPVNLPQQIRHDCYTKVMSSYGSLNMTPEEVLELGFSELERAEQEMFSIVSRQLELIEEGMSNEYRANTINLFLEYLSNDPNQLFATKEEYISYVGSLITKGIDILPSVTTHSVNPPTIEDLDHEATNSPGAQYHREKARILINSKTPYAKYKLPSLIAHEGVPGHHLEYSVTQDNLTTQFQKNNSFTGYTEGWAFYMEEYLDQLGFYQSDFERLGYLEDIRVRALRLIIPYKLFLGDWTYQKAFEFTTEHSSMPEFRLNSELSRNLDWRGQVLGYMLGKHSILKMKAKAKEKLGDGYSDQIFHDFVLSHGKTTLKSLDKKLDKWIEARKD